VSLVVAGLDQPGRQDHGDGRSAIEEEEGGVGKEQLRGSDAKAIANGNAKIAEANWEDSIFISNNLPYAPKLEKGYSKQAPQGMMRITFLELRQSIRRLITAAGQQGGGQP
jgi:hypothetical protein